MRFDDMIATVLEQPGDRPDRISAIWRQLVDLLAQRGGAAEGAQSDRAFAFLREVRRRIDPDLRREAALSLRGLPVAPDLVAFFAEDSPSIAAPIISGARLDAEAWISLLPRLGPAARSLLRHRRDLPASVGQALGVFGPSDFVIEGTRGEAPSPAAGAEAGAEAGELQIRELVERIEAYRRHQDEVRQQVRLPIDAEQAAEFRWEAGTDGVVRWVEGAPREALIGQSLATIAGPGQHGVDGQVAGAVEKRSPFRDARFSVPGQGLASGDWRISGVPFFDPSLGSFLGYRGTARRPRVDETAQPSMGSAMFGPQLPADSLRQLIHELRTPLNAIVGFAELIEGQYMGPAARGYRNQAAEIMDQARRLLSAVDDLDTAARIETQRLDLSDDSSVDAAVLLGRLHESYERVAGQRGVLLTLAITADLPLVRVEAGAVERMFARLLAATIGLAGSGETIATNMESARRRGGTMLRLSVDRPRAIAGLDESDLLDPGYSPDGDWPGAPALGLGFALRLVRNLAEAAGGGLLIGQARISLELPALAETSASVEQGEGGA